MCGIAGYIGQKGIGESVINELMMLMKNRGPDYQAFLRINWPLGQGVLIHSRLGILDLNPRSNQPFEFENWVIIFNGEIYNYLEIREELTKNGEVFYTNSDTEVVLRLFARIGVEAFRKFEGMWAIAIYNKTSGELVLSRDRFGEKPLLYYREGDDFFFGSEVKFISKLLGRTPRKNIRHCLRYLANGYKSLFKSNETYYEGVFFLRPGHYIVIKPGFRGVELPYWSYQRQEFCGSIEEAVEQTNFLLLKSLRLRLRSDVPIAFCLSGGIDSSGLVAMAVKKLGYNPTTFSVIDQDQRYNESKNIDLIVKDLGVENIKIHLGEESTFEKLKKLIAYHDGPVATISYFAHSLIMEKISALGFRVSVSGTSADEIFSGYYDHFLLHLMEVEGSRSFSKYLKDWEKWILPIVRNPFLMNPERYAKNPIFRDHIFVDYDEGAKFLKLPFHEFCVETCYDPGLMKNRMLNEIFHEVTPVILNEDDLNSMYLSVENRSPYLDTELFEFGFSLPREYLIQNGYAKHVLRSALNGILLDEVRLDRRKVGFNAALESIVDFSNKQTVEFLLEDSPVFDLVDRQAISEIIKDPLIISRSSKFLFGFINLKIFFEQGERQNEMV